MAYNGTVKDMFPPHNDGTRTGAGMIDGETGDNLVFQTPGDNNGQVLAVGQAISYEVNAQGNITSVSADGTIGNNPG
jgi:hypothetical protein